MSPQVCSAFVQVTLSPLRTILHASPGYSRSIDCMYKAFAFGESIALGEDVNKLDQAQGETIDPQLSPRLSTHLKAVTF